MSSHVNRTIAAIFSIAALAGCDRASSERAITIERTASRVAHPVQPGITTAQRLRAERPAPARPKPLGWDLPAGWTDKPDPSGMRVGSFALASSPEADCSITLLPGAAGGVPANVNRWRKQMGLVELSPEEIAKLPTRPLLRQGAVIVDLDGTFTGMGETPRPEWKLLGAITQLDLPGLQPIAVFVKLTGPRAAVEQERKAFDALCDSLRFAAHGGGHGPDDGHGHGPDDGHGHGEPALAWQAPAGWQQEGPRPMRTVSFRIGTGTECYVSELPAQSGVLANVNRWLKQMGQPALDEKGLRALPAITALGQEVPLLETTGTYADTNGGSHAGFALLGVAAVRGEQLVFVKMVGPEAEVRAERERFRAFAGSLR